LLKKALQKISRLNKARSLKKLGPSEMMELKSGLKILVSFSQTVRSLALSKSLLATQWKLVPMWT